MSSQLTMMRNCCYPQPNSILRLWIVLLIPLLQKLIFWELVRCGPSKYAGRSTKKCREITIADDQKNQFMLTLWEDFGEIEGTELQAKIKNAEEFPVILGRNSGVFGYQVMRPFNAQALKLMNWAKTNKSILSSQVSDGFSGLSAPPVMPPAHQQLISIAEITSETKVGVFYVEAEMVISNDLQQFCVLECPGCKQKKRTKDRKPFDCPKCQRPIILVPRCTFQVDLIDGSASITASISGVLAEKLLSMTTKEIFETACVKHQLLRVNHIQHMLSNRLFRIQLKKSSWINSNVTHTSVTILSYVEKEQEFLPIIDERNTKKVRAVGTAEENVKATDIESESSSASLAIEPCTRNARKDKSFDIHEVKMKAVVESESSASPASIEPPTPAKKEVKGSVFLILVTFGYWKRVVFWILILYSFTWYGGPLM